MDLKVPYSNLTSADEAFEIAKKLITPDYVKRFQVKADIDTDDALRSLRASGKGFKLELTFDEQAALVTLDLSFFLKALKSNILRKVEKELKEKL